MSFPKMVDVKDVATTPRRLRSLGGPNRPGFHWKDGIVRTNRADTWIILCLMPSMLSVMVCQLVITNWVNNVVGGSMTFPSASPASPLAGLDLYAAPVTSFMGPQAGDPDNTRTGPIILFDGDICKPNNMQAPGGVVVITSTEVAMGACSFETKYLNLYTTGASGVVLALVDQVPSVVAYANDGSRGAHTRDLPMLFLAVGPSTGMYNTLITASPGNNVTLSPDVNVWQAMFSSWQCQILVRVLPSAVLTGSGLTAAAYLAAHMRIIHSGYKIAAPESRRSAPRLAMFIGKSFGLPQAVLTIEMVTATLSGVILAVDGYYTTSRLPFPVVGYFSTLLSGWSFASSLMSASVWIRHLSRIVASKSLLNRVLRGDYPITFVVLAAIPVAFDTAASIMFSMSYYKPAVTTSVSAVVFLFQLTVGLHVLVGVVRYYITVHDVRTRTGNAVGTASGMATVLGRLSRCAFGMSLSTILICTGTVLIALSPAFLYTPAGWLICFSVSYSGRALDSAFRVAMFRPRSSRPSSKPAVVAIVPKPKKSSATSGYPSTPAPAINA